MGMGKVAVLFWALSWSLVVVGQECMPFGSPSMVFNEYGTRGEVVSRVFDRTLVRFDDGTGLQRRRLSELAVPRGRGWSFCAGEEAFAVSLSSRELGKEPFKSMIGLGRAIGGVAPDVDADGDVVVMGIYTDETVVIELPEGATRRVTPYILAHKQGSTLDGHFRVGDEIPWIWGQTLTVRGIFYINGDIAVSYEPFSRQDFRMPTSEVIIKEGQSWSGYSVGDRVVYPSDDREGIVRAIGWYRNTLFVEPTNYLPDADGTDIWHLGLDEWPIQDGVRYETLDQ